MIHRFGWSAALLAFGVMAVGVIQLDVTAGGGKDKFKGKERPKFAPAKWDLTEALLEVEALQTLDALELTPIQLDFLASLAKETREKPRPRRLPTVSAEYRKTLLALHAALVKNDSKQVDEWQEKLDALTEKEKVQLDNEVEITEAARKRVTDFLRQLRVTQVLSYLDTVEIDDPIDLLENALKQSQEKNGKRWTKTRDETAEAVAQLLGGISKSKSEEVRRGVLKLLDRAHQLKPAEFAEQFKSLQAEAHELAGRISPFDIVRNQVAWSFAELLSNPRLGAAVEMRKAHPHKNELP